MDELTARVSLGEMQRATNTAAITALVEASVLPGTDWRIHSVRRRSVRLEPPDDYWAVYRVRLFGGEAPAEATWPDSYARSEELRLVVRGIFDRERWENYRAHRLAPFEAQRFAPLQGGGRLLIDDDAQFAVWAFPFDPILTTLQNATDGAVLHGVFSEGRATLLDGVSAVHSVVAERNRYLPEISAVLRYRVSTDAGERILFGKVLRAGAALGELMEEIWQVAQSSEGLLRIPRPRGHHPALDLYLEDAAPGEEVSGDRSRPEFLEASVAAAEALAALHGSDLVSDIELRLEDEVARLQEIGEQFVLVHPRAHNLMSELRAQLRGHLRSAEEDDWVPSHGDIKYDQLIRAEDGSHCVIDFEYFGMAETSWDLAKWCAHAVPSMPQDWQESAAAEDARAAFLNRYLELRPQATLQRFPIHEATHLALRAMVLMWGQMPGWEDAAESLLVLAMERLKQPAP